MVSIFDHYYRQKELRGPAPLYNQRRRSNYDVNDDKDTIPHRLAVLYKDVSDIKHYLKVPERHVPTRKERRSRRGSTTSINSLTSPTAQSAAAAGEHVGGMPVSPSGQLKQRLLKAIPPLPKSLTPELAPERDEARAKHSTRLPEDGTPSDNSGVDLMELSKALEEAHMSLEPSFRLPLSPTAEPWPELNGSYKVDFTT